MVYKCLSYPRSWNTLFGVDLGYGPHSPSPQIIIEENSYGEDN